MKLLAAVGVILIHLAPSTEAAETFTRIFHIFAVPFFLLISLYFSINRIIALPSPKLSDLRWDRILLPYSVWTPVYLIAKVLKYYLRGEPVSIDIWGSVFFGGSAVHLYFLPLLLLFQAQAFAAILLFRGRTFWLTSISVAFGAVAFGWLASVGNRFGFDHCLERGFMYVGSTFLLRHIQAMTGGLRINLTIGCLIATLAVLTVLFGGLLNELGYAEGPVVGYGVAALTLNWNTFNCKGLSRRLLTCSYGIYLAHFAFLEALEMGVRKLGWALTPYTVMTKVALAGLICACCFFLILTARLHRLAAYLFLGEAPTDRNSASPTDQANK